MSFQIVAAVSQHLSNMKKFSACFDEFIFIQMRPSAFVSSWTFPARREFPAMRKSIRLEMPIRTLRQLQIFTNTLNVKSKKIRKDFLSNSETKNYIHVRPGKARIISPSYQQVPRK